MIKGNRCWITQINSWRWDQKKNNQKNPTPPPNSFTKASQDMEYLYTYISKASEFKGHAIQHLNNTILTRSAKCAHVHYISHLQENRDSYLEARKKHFHKYQKKSYSPSLLLYSPSQCHLSVEKAEWGGAKPKRPHLGTFQLCAPLQIAPDWQNVGWDLVPPERSVTFLR